MKPIYQPQPKRIMRLIVFFSGGASALKYLLERDANLGKKYAIVGAFTDTKDASGIALVRGAGIELECLDIRDWCRAHRKKLTDLGARREYFAEVCSLIRRFQADVIMLSGFMRLITEPLLSEYKHRILNVHPADLTALDEEGRRRYVGMDAVSKAIAAGEKFTRSTIHLVTEEVDGGPIVALSEPLPVEPGVDPKAHQELMKWACDGPAYQKALALIADGRVWLDSATGRVEIACSSRKIC